MKVLIAEDDLHIGEGLREVLEAEGYTALLASDGEQALVMFQSQRPQLVLLDIMMPKRDGYAVCREIRRVDNEIDRVIGLELGADDYIMKPFGVREVVARIRAVTRRTLARQPTPELASNSVWIGDLELFPSQLRARRGETQIDLSLRDVKILQYLLQHKGQVVDRDSLFNQCWGRDYFPNSRTLDQHISKLRKLIELDPKAPTIIGTVHGVGYRYE